MIVSRPYQGEADYQRIRQMLIESLALSGPPDYATIGDIDWWRATAGDPNGVYSVQLWLDGERLAGFVWPSEHQADILVHPEYRAIEEAMIAWAEERVIGTAGEAAAESAVWSFGRDDARNAMLERRGYRRSPEGLNYRLRPLDGPVPNPVLPPGYVVRHLAGESELEQRVAVHRDAFAPSRMTVEKHRRVMAAPTYRQDLDLVVVAPDGSLAAYCIVWLDAANRLVEFEPVGTHTAHRRLGLGKAVMLEGCRRAQALGARVATVSSIHGAAGPNRLYESAGFSLLDTCWKWTRSLERARRQN